MASTDTTEAPAGSIAPSCAKGCGAKDADARVKLIQVARGEVGDGTRDADGVPGVRPALMGEFRCEACGTTVFDVLGADAVVPAWVPERPAGWQEDGRVHLRVGQDETEIVGQRTISGALTGETKVIDLKAPKWLGIVRDVVAAIKERTADEATREWVGYPAFLGSWWVRGVFAEEYSDFRVLHRRNAGDGTVSICSKTPAGALALHEAADRRRMYYAGMERFGVAPENR